LGELKEVNWIMAKEYTLEEKMTRCKCDSVLMFEPMMPGGGVMTVARTVNGINHTVEQCGQYVKKNK
jgi:hypothetical protein